jgi:hypothetical protein
MDIKVPKSRRSGEPHNSSAAWATRRPWRVVTRIFVAHGRKRSLNRCPGDTSFPSSAPDDDQHSDHDGDNANCAADLNEQQNGATIRSYPWIVVSSPSSEQSWFVILDATRCSRVTVTAPRVCAVLVSIVLIRAKCKQALSVVIAHDEAGGLFLDRPRWREAAFSGHRLGKF